jgi:GT2 family glycosyltransferase
MAFSVVIPSKNAVNLSACVGAIRAAGETCRIIVVDDGVDVGSSADWDEDTEWIPGIKPFIFSRNCNLGIAAAGTDDVILCNDDCLLESPQGFTHLISAINADPQYGCIGATTDMTGQPLQWRKDPASPKYGLRSVGHIAFVCVAIPRRTIDELGGLDERYCLDYGCEDRDYCEAIVRSGKKVGVLDDCFVNHSKLTSSFRGSGAGQTSFAQNYKLLIEKWKTIQP